VVILEFACWRNTSDARLFPGVACCLVFMERFHMSFVMAQDVMDFDHRSPSDSLIKPFDGQARSFQLSPRMIERRVVQVDMPRMFDYSNSESIQFGYWRHPPEKSSTFSRSVCRAGRATRKMIAPGTTSLSSVPELPELTRASFPRRGRSVLASLASRSVRPSRCPRRTDRCLYHCP
jgi:hypothetical protein